MTFENWVLKKCKGSEKGVVTPPHNLSWKCDFNNRRCHFEPCPDSGIATLARGYRGAIQANDLGRRLGQSQWARRYYRGQ
jgi:hypothetical protein